MNLNEEELKFLLSFLEDNMSNDVFTMDKARFILNLYDKLNEKLKEIEE